MHRADIGKVIERKWMGIEPTWRLFSRHTGFEDQGSHQIYLHFPRSCERYGYDNHDDQIMVPSTFHIRWIR